jgi:hypothetical protein
LLPFWPIVGLPHHSEETIRPNLSIAEPERPRFAANAAQAGDEAVATISVYPRKRHAHRSWRKTLLIALV